MFGCRGYRLETKDGAVHPTDFLWRIRLFYYVAKVKNLPTINRYNIVQGPEGLSIEKKMCPCSSFPDIDQYS